MTSNEKYKEKIKMKIISLKIVFLKLRIYNKKTMDLYLKDFFAVIG